jgi:hypothetical protein
VAIASLPALASKASAGNSLWRSGGVQNIVRPALETDLMNRPLSARRRRRFALTWLLPLLYGASLLRPSGPCLAADLPKEIRTADDATAYKVTIDAYLQREVAAILADDPQTKAAAQARESLIDEVRAGITPPSASFLDTYCAELQFQLAPLVAPTAGTRPRLNAAIVVARVAASSQDVNLIPLIITQLKDPNEAVVLWALKSSQSVLVPALNVAALKAKLIDAIIQSAERIKSGPVVSAAYDALTTTDKTVTTAGLADLITPVQRLLNWRLQQYAVALPPEPPSDGKGTAFLTQRAVWLAAPQSQKPSAQILLNLAAAALKAQATAMGEDRDELTQLLKKVGLAIYVIGYNSADETLKTAATPLSNIDQRPPPMPAAAAVAQAVAALAAKVPGLTLPVGLSAPAAGSAAPPQH